MRPKFSNFKLRTLWYLLYYGSAVAAGATIAMYKNGLVGMAAMIAIIVVAIAVLALLIPFMPYFQDMQIHFLEGKLGKYFFYFMVFILIHSGAYNDKIKRAGQPEESTSQKE